MKRMFFKVALVIMGLIVILGCGKQQSKDNFKIGANFSLSGNLAYWSTELKNGIDFAKIKLDTLNRLKIIYEDNQGRANEAVNVFKKLATINKINVVITCFTPIGQPLRDFAEIYKVPLVATVTSAHNFAEVNKWTFRDFPTQDQQATALANYVFNNMKMKKGSYLIVNDDYGRDGAKIFKDTFTKMGGVIYEGDLFSQTDKSMRNQINKVLFNKPEFLLIIGRDQALATVCKQVREVNKDIKIVGVNAFDAAIVWDLIGEAGEGVVFTSAYVDYESSPAAMQFKNDYLTMYNEIPSYVAVYGYTITRYLLDIFEKVGNDNDKIRNEIENMDIVSIRGHLKTNKVRDIISPIGIYIREGNNSKLIMQAEQ